jgi:DNA-directed RNA polymerase subunit RPC12/RpoP
MDCMRPNANTETREVYECFECGGRIDEPETRRCQDCGGELFNVSRSRDL